jgi:hypothetical protein
MQQREPLPCNRAATEGAVAALRLLECNFLPFLPFFAKKGKKIGGKIEEKNLGT